MSSKKKQRHESGESTDSTDTVGDYIPTPPDGGWGWVIVASSLMCNIIVDGLGYSFGVLLPQWVEVFNESRSKISLVGSLLIGVYLCAGPLVSGLTNKFGCRAVTIAGSVLACGGFILASVCKSVNVLLLTYGVMGGLGFGLMYLPAIVIVGYYFEKKRAIATGIAVCGSGVGTFIFSPANAAMLEAFDWRNMLMIHAGIILNGCVCGMLMRPLEAPKKKRARTKNMLDRAKEKVRFTKQHHDSESSVQVVDKFKKLQEAKLRRERQLYDSDDSSVVPGRQDCDVTSPTHRQSYSEKIDNTEIPKIVIGEAPIVDKNQDQSTNKTESVTEGNNQNESRVQENDESESTIPNKNGNLPTGVFAHEVHPLIENGYAKSSSPTSSRARTYSSAQRLKLGSQHNIDKKDYARPLYRKDIFYSGSIYNIPQYRSQPDVKTYVTSITSIPGETEDLPASSCWDQWTCLPKSVVDTLKDMLDVSLFTDIPFVLICVGNLFAMSGFYVPFSYLVDHAIILGIDKTKAAFLLSVIGITNTVGRILSGLLVDMTKLEALLINNIALVVSAVLLFLEPFCTSYELLLVFSAIYGLCVAAYISLTSIIICDLLGLQKLTNAFGLLTLARGIAGIYGPPVAGSVFAATGTYDYSFYLGGAMFALGAACHLVLHLPCLKRKSKESEELDVIE